MNEAEAEFWIILIGVLGVAILGILGMMVADVIHTVRVNRIIKNIGRGK